MGKEDPLPLSEHPHRAEKLLVIREGQLVVVPQNKVSLLQSMPTQLAVPGQGVLVRCDVTHQVHHIALLHPFLPQPDDVVVMFLDSAKDTPSTLVAQDLLMSQVRISDDLGCEFFCHTRSKLLSSMYSSIVIAIMPTGAIILGGDSQA